MSFRPLCLRASVPSCLVIMLSMLALTGCARTDGPSFLAIDAKQYHEAFDAAVDVARRYELTASLRDRRSGVIETEPTAAGTILEPWKRSTLSVNRALESTFSYQRRRARFEFLPIEFAPDGDVERKEVVRDADLTIYEGELELRVWVYVERSHVPGVRRSTWSRRLSSRATIIEPETGEPVGGGWTPIARDPLLERHLLAKIKSALQGG